MRLQAILYIFHCIAAPDHFVRAIWSRTTRSLYVRTRKVKRWIQRWSNDECSEDVLHTILVNSTYCTIFVRHVMSSGKRPIQLACTIQLGLNTLFSNETYCIQHVWVKDNAAIITTLCAKQCEIVESKDNDDAKGSKTFIPALFGCMCIYFNPHVLEWIGMKLSSIALQSIWTHVDWNEYMCIQIRPPVRIEWSSYRIILRRVSTSSLYHIAEYCRHPPTILHARAHSDHIDICMNFLSNHVHSLSIL